MSGVVGPSPAPKRVARPSWLDLRLVLGVVLVVASTLIGAAVFAAADHKYAMVTATRDLASGTILHSDDLAMTQVQLPAHGDGIYLSRVDAALGKRLGRDVSAGELVPAAAIARVPAQTTVTIPFAAGNAPELRPGQRIEVWVSTPTCASVVLLHDVTVQDVHSDTGAFTAGAAGQDVVVSVERALADRIVAALALDQAEIRAGALIGSSGPTPDPAVTPGSGPGGLPDDLTACAGRSAGG